MLDVTGSADATIGVLGVYDIFGLAIQTLQGADYLASLLNAIVILPDFFHGDAVQAAWFPPDTDEKRALVTEFISTKAALPLNSELLKTVIKSAKAKFSSITKWGAYGLCWGGKVWLITSSSIEVEMILILRSLLLLTLARSHSSLQVVRLILGML